MSRDNPLWGAPFGKGLGSADRPLLNRPAKGISSTASAYNCW